MTVYLASNTINFKELKVTMSTLHMYIHGHVHVPEKAASFFFARLIVG